VSQKNPKNKQDIGVILETMALEMANANDGKTSQSSVVDRWIDRLHADASLLGLDFRAHAQADVEKFFNARKPDWSQPIMDCFADRLWIPYNRDGDKVLLLKATKEHWEAYTRIQGDNNKIQTQSYSNFEAKAQWVKEHWKPNHKTIGDVVGG